MPSSRLRVHQYLPFLRASGIEPTVLPALNDPWFSRFYYSKSKAARLFHLGAEAVNGLRRALAGSFYDLVFVQKGITLSNFRGLEKLIPSSRPLIFDVDDTVFGKNLMEYRLSWLRVLQDSDQTVKLARRASAVIAGNTYLKKLALGYNKNVFVVSTPVDTARIFPKRNPAGQSKTVIGWLGVPGGLMYFPLIAEALQKLSARYPLTLRLVSRFNGERFSIPGVNIEYVDWDYSREVPDLQSFDIGIAPLAEDDWTQGKCALKLLQYMAAGLPAVASRSGMNSEVIEDGVDGFLAQGTEEWTEKLSRLVEDVSLRKKIGEGARQKVERQYSLEQNARRLSEILFEVARP